MHRIVFHTIEILNARTFKYVVDYYFAEHIYEGNLETSCNDKFCKYIQDYSRYLNQFKIFIGIICASIRKTFLFIYFYVRRGVEAGVKR